MTVTKVKETKVVEVDVFRCDICGKVIGDSRGYCGMRLVMKCELCGRDCCKDCRVVYNDYGDYPTAIHCKHCDVVFQENKHLLDDEYHRHEEEEEKIRRFIKDEAIRTLTEECDLEDERV